MKPARLCAALALLLLTADAPAQGRDNAAKRGGGVRMPAPAFRTEVPAHELDVVLGRPTGEGITFSVLAAHDHAAELAVWRPEPETPPVKFPLNLKAGTPAELRVDHLQPDTRYRYRLTQTDGILAEGGFTTARPPGAAFTFTVQADSHLDGGTEPGLYERSLARVRASRPDFHVDLGDTFMTDKRNDFHEARANYLAQRHYFGLLGPVAPVFLVLGNHDGEQTGRGGSGPDSMAVWANGMRKRYFPNPEPDAFYAGNRTPHPVAGLLQDYYAWTWGDALFVVLDPFWFSGRTGRDGDNWSWTLGREQYEWLRGVLQASPARYKFVFLHNLVGGETREARGGAEASRFFEWGGRELDGRDTFAAHRPGWEAPIHDLLVRHGVTAVFHGHDHLYAYQQRDGLVYQEVPQPGHPRPGARSAAEYGYRSGQILPGSGVLRVRVAPDKAVVEFLRVDQPDDAVAHGYELKPRG